MMEQMVLPITERMFWLLVILVGIAVFSGLVFGVLPGIRETSSRPPREPLQARMGLDDLDSGLFILFFGFWLLVILSLLTGFVALLWEVIAQTAPQEATAIWDWRFMLAKLTALTATLGAVVALPVTIIRLRLNYQQTETAKEALFNDKINAAATDLAARRQVTRVVEQGSSEVVLTEWEDDIVKRVVAIGRLEELARQNLKSHLLIVEMLCVYIRANAPIDRNNDDPPDDEIPQIWIAKHPRPRSDVQAALDVIGRRTDEQVAHEMRIGYQVNLSATNLRGCVLRHGNLSNAELVAVRLDGATIDGTKFVNSNLRHARFRYASAFNCNFSESDLELAVLTNGLFCGTDFTGSNMFSVQAQQCELYAHSIIPADRAIFTEANIVDATFVDNQSIAVKRLQQEEEAIFQGAFTSERTFLLRNSPVADPSFSFVHLRRHSVIEHDAKVEWHRWRIRLKES